MKYQGPGSFETTEIYCSQSWRLGIWDQSASRVRWGPSSGLQTSCCILTWLPGSREFCGVTFIKALIFSWRLLPQAPPSINNTIPLGIRILTYEFKGDIHDQTSPFTVHKSHSMYATKSPLCQWLKRLVSFSRQELQPASGDLGKESLIVEINSSPTDAWQ